MRLPRSGDDGACARRGPTSGRGLDEDDGQVPTCLDGPVDEAGVLRHASGSRLPTSTRARHLCELETMAKDLVAVMTGESEEVVVAYDIGLPAEVSGRHAAPNIRRAHLRGLATASQRVRMRAQTRVLVGRSVTATAYAGRIRAMSSLIVLVAWSSSPASAANCGHIVTASRTSRTAFR